MPDVALVALGLLRHVGGKTLRSLLAHFNGEIRDILAADVKTLRAVPGVGAKIAQAITEIDLEQVKNSLDHWQTQGIQAVTWHDSTYPRILRTLDDAPPVLFYRGSMAPSPIIKAVSIVGTREPSPDSIHMAQTLAAEFVRRGYVIVSGLALGIDTAAHRGALASLNGHTLAVLGSGILDLYPPENKLLAKAVMFRGALMCEVSPAAGVSASGLVARNRIITGLSEAVIVIETKVDGGAMHAARFAQLQKKRLYAIDNHASGNRVLIENGALPIPPKFSNLDWFTDNST